MASAPFAFSPPMPLGKRQACLQTRSWGRQSESAARVCWKTDPALFGQEADHPVESSVEPHVLSPHLNGDVAIHSMVYPLSRI